MRANLYMVDPDELTIVVDKDDPLYDPRVDLPVEESMVLNIMHHGVIQNIRIIRRGSDRVVVTGRQRVKAAREANKRLKAEGKELVRIPAAVAIGDETDHYGVMISENEIRQGDSILGKADKCKKFLQMGRSTREAATVFGVTEQTVKNWMELVGMSSSVKKAVDQGLISATAAVKMSGMSPGEQKEAVTELVQSAKDSGKKRVSVKSASVAAGKKSSSRSKKEIREMIDLIDEPWARAALKWATGDIDEIDIELLGR